ncbi:hypothetical protein ASPZODRAFT_76693 [Penicilliopsis zonata CBS 506.65]|uniref:Tat pathway signal sequence n=1 Tax=Penicilliopsis zonata CBS 506.65 TaxID=1073090 RepID=A0A1L9S5S9_9EURO|nr:hypothetical protein ASPZODRAFT_76693 [Penicilliopsis zonata CBS 506.65]OJJ42509.1 hypothetical protein ASPZODRAFT_76693 [Penicilliopsis zonata CBS 506.65]
MDQQDSCHIPTPRESGELEKEYLLEENSRKTKRTPWKSSVYHLYALYTTNGLLLFILLMLLAQMRQQCLADPSLGVYSPANTAVEYIKEVPFRAALFNNTPYMGFPTDETDKLWSDLYNSGLSKISEDEARKLSVPTLPIPGTKDYLVELDVWHELHCLNDLRMVLYPERYKGLDDLKDENGVIQRDNDAFRHWDHCIDSLRQAIMCHADVAPISFHINVPVSSGIFPRLATTHTCRNFTKVQEWARDHKAGEWNFSVSPEEAEQIIRTAGFDQSPLEDIEFLWPSFPGNTFFKHWQENLK